MNSRTGGGDQGEGVRGAYPSPLTASSARLVVLGSAGLVEGFGLIGAELHPDADSARVEAVLAELVASGREALVLLETHLAHAGGPLLNQLRNSGGRIVVTELPPLFAPEAFSPAVDAVVRTVLGPEALQP